MWSATPTPTPTMGVIEHCRVSPPPHTVAQTSLPLTFFDLLWLNLAPFSRLLFYDLKLTTTNFTQQHLPNLKKSLSIALQHYFPLAGHLITPTTCNNNNTTSTTKPIIRYLDGDSVELTVAEYSSYHNIAEDFIRLAGNQPRDFDQLSVLAPQLAPPIKEVSPDDHGEYCEVKVSPVLSVQVTIFPNQGICLGLTTSHAVADGSSIYNFIRAWGLISKHMSSDSTIITSRLFNLPFHDRSVIQDPNDLAGIYTSQMGENYNISQTRRPPPPGLGLKKVRATFMLCQSDIEALKKLVSTKLPRLAHLSSFTVACGYLWSCLAKTHYNVIDSNIQDLQDEDDHHLIFAVNCRAHLDPPLHETYFGNCITTCFISANNSQLVAEGGEGFVRAAEVIGESIHKKLREGGGIMKDAETWYEKVKEMTTTVWKGERITGIAGSPKFNLYDIDFGWGKPRKYEFVSQRLSSSGGKDARGDMEFGVCLPEDEMEVFSTIFKESLQIIIHS